MNEQIFELAKRADLIQWDTLPSGARTPDHESVVKANKFAELIIKKCISQIALIGISNFENEDISWTVETAIANIKEHFGIKNGSR